MRSFFKKPNWATKADSPSQPTEFYRRSDQVYADILATEPDDEDTTESSSAQAQAPKAKKKDQLRETTRAPKRRRISRSESDDDSVDLEKKGSSQSISTRDEIERQLSSEIKGEHRAASEEYDEAGSVAAVIPPVHTRNTRAQARFKDSPRKPGIQPADVVDVGSDSEEPQPNKPGERQLLEDTTDDEVEEVEEFPELARKARERAREREAATQATRQPAGDTSIDNRTLPAVPSPRAVSLAKSTSNTPDRTAPERIVKIYISSDLENTNDLIVHRKLDQNLGDVRLAWCARQGFNEDMTSKVYLTWKGRRLFDVTSCRGLRVQDEKPDDLPMIDELNDDDGSIPVHMEAVTEELHEERKRRMHKTPFDDSEGSELETKEPDNSFRLVIKAPDMEDFRIKVRPTNHIHNIISNLREKRQIPPEKKVRLLFDGDVLDPQLMIQDHDFDDLDAIDAQIR
ncbi:hypothetical protein FQN50_001347 [Emmonsiellopsis sp. PD_5]|nr:hypothetical protein FQN50_001347 [Emmonsiellopsis sp. PD_5]